MTEKLLAEVLNCIRTIMRSKPMRLAYFSDSAYVTRHFKELFMSLLQTTATAYEASITMDV